MRYMRFPHDPVMRMLVHNYMNQEHETERRCQWMPATNVAETDQAFKLEMAVPGFSKEDFTIELEKNILTVSSKKDEKEGKTEENDRWNCHQREFGHRGFSRSFIVPDEVEKDTIKAEYENGILTITLPKREEVKIKKEIQVV
jgi:HSP20 family protein